MTNQELWDSIKAGEFAAKTRKTNQIDLPSQSGEELSLDAYYPVLIKDSKGEIVEMDAKEAFQYLQTQENKDDNAIVLIQVDHYKDVTGLYIEIAGEHPVIDACDQVTYEFASEYPTVGFEGRRIHGRLMGEVNGENGTFTIQGAIVDAKNFDILNSGLVLDPSTYEVSKSWKPSNNAFEAVVEIRIGEKDIPAEGSMTYFGHGITVAGSGDDLTPDFYAEREKAIQNEKAKAKKNTNAMVEKFQDSIATAKATIAEKNQENQDRKVELEKISEDWADARKELADADSDAAREEGLKKCNDLQGQRRELSITQKNSEESVHACEDSVKAMEDDKAGLVATSEKFLQEGDDLIGETKKELDDLYDSGLFEEDNSEDPLPDGPA